jgi:hypothetical protein
MRDIAVLGLSGPNDAVGLHHDDLDENLAQRLQATGPFFSRSQSLTVDPIRIAGRLARARDRPERS